MIKREMNRYNQLKEVVGPSHYPKLIEKSS